ERRLLALEVEGRVGGRADGGAVGPPGHVVHRRPLELAGDGGVTVAALARAGVVGASRVRRDQTAGGRRRGRGGRGAGGGDDEAERGDAVSWHGRHGRCRWMWCASETWGCSCTSASWRWGWLCGPTGSGPSCPCRWCSSWTWACSCSNASWAWR